MKGDCDTRQEMDDHGPMFYFLLFCFFLFKENCAVKKEMVTTEKFKLRKSRKDRVLRVLEFPNFKDKQVGSIIRKVNCFSQV